MDSIDLRILLDSPEDYLRQRVKLQGWIRNHRKQKSFGFIDFFDGTCFASLQVVYDASLPNFSEVSAYRVGSAIGAVGQLVPSQGKTGGWELKAERVTLLGDCGGIPAAQAPFAGVLARDCVPEAPHAAFPCGIPHPQHRVLRDTLLF